MKNIKSSNKVYVSKSKIKDAGIGVFAMQPIRHGDIIENCPIIKVSLKDPSNNDNGILVDYFFYFGDALAIALGFGSLYNHSYQPNAKYQTNLKNKTIDFTAIKDISVDEEITVNYNFGNPKITSTPTVRGIPTFEKK